MKRYVDLEEIIREENHDLFQKLKDHPLPIFPLLRFLLQEKKINYFLNRYPSRDLLFVEDFLKKELGIRWRVHGEEKIDPKRRYIFVANHSHGGIDGLLFLAAVGGIFSEVKIMVNRVLLKLEKLNGVFLPVNVFSPTTRKQMTQVKDYLRSPHPLLIFPAGVVARQGSGSNRKQLIENRWKKSFLELAVTYERDVVPTFIDIRNSFWFYSLAKLRSRLQIKSNLEMFLLPREISRTKNKSIDIYYSDPISYESIVREQRRHSLPEIAAELRTFVINRFEHPLPCNNL